MHHRLAIAFPLLLVPSAALAQTAGSAPSTPVIAPTFGGGQVGQPPANSAMRNAGGGIARPTPRANPMGMAGMGMAGSGSSTNALTLSDGGSAGRTGGMQAGGAQAGQQTVRITDTGVTQRARNGRQPR